MDATIEISDNCDAWQKVVCGLEARLRDVVRAALVRTAFAADKIGRPAEISILLSDDAGIRALNRRYRGIDRPTNVLAFPSGDDGFSDIEPFPGSGQPVHALGDIVLAFETVTAEAADQGKEFGDHMAHLVIHGVLHLLGHDHERDDDAKVMEALEVGTLADLGISNPYLSGNYDPEFHD